MTSSATRQTKYLSKFSLSSPHQTSPPTCLLPLRTVTQYVIPRSRSQQAIGISSRYRHSNMSTLTRRSSGNRVPDYKDYMSFVSAYRNGKKETDANEDQAFILSTNEGRMAPEVSGFNGKVCDSYSSFLEKTRNKKFSSVKPPSVPLDPPKDPKKPVKVKTEIFLQINNDAQEPPKTLDFSVTDQTPDISDEDSIAPGQVEARKKMFEGRTQSENKTTPLSNAPNQKTKILTLKKQLETNSSKTTENLTLAPTVKTVNSPNHHKIETQIEINTTNGTKDIPPQTNTTDGAQNIQNFHLIEKRNNELQADITSKEKLIGQLNEALKFKSTITLETEDETKKETTENIRIVNIPKDSSIPPPPPPMPNGFNQIPKINKITMKPNREKDNASLPTHYSVQETDTDRSCSKNQKSSTLERTNPLVRKLAYGAMLDMYGAYHEKANSYVSTLPRQNVRKDNGLQKIIDSIAAQGGLDKLSGRSNPKAENE